VCKTSTETRSRADFAEKKDSQPDIDCEGVALLLIEEKVESVGSLRAGISAGVQLQCNEKNKNARSDVRCIIYISSSLRAVDTTKGRMRHASEFISACSSCLLRHCFNSTTPSMISPKHKLRAQLRWQEAFITLPNRTSVVMSLFFHAVSTPMHLLTLALTAKSFLSWHLQHKSPLYKISTKYS